MTGQDLDRRSFLGLAAVMATTGSLVAAPAREDKEPLEQLAIQLKWRIIGPMESPSYILDFGVGETWLWSESNDTRWQMRCGDRWRPSKDPFIGTLDNAKVMAERFTRYCLKDAVIAVEKVVYAIKREELP